MKRSPTLAAPAFPCFPPEYSINSGIVGFGGSKEPEAVEAATDGPVFELVQFLTARAELEGHEIFGGGIEAGHL